MPEKPNPAIYSGDPLHAEFAQIQQELARMPINAAGRKEKVARQNELVNQTDASGVTNRVKWVNQYLDTQDIPAAVRAQILPKYIPFKNGIPFVPPEITWDKLAAMHIHLEDKKSALEGRGDGEKLSTIAGAFFKSGYKDKAECKSYVLESLIAASYDMSSFPASTLQYNLFHPHGHETLKHLVDAGMRFDGLVPERGITTLELADGSNMVEHMGQAGFNVSGLTEHKADLLRSAVGMFISMLRPNPQTGAKAPYHRLQEEMVNLSGDGLQKLITLGGDINAINLPAGEPAAPTPENLHLFTVNMATGVGQKRDGGKEPITVLDMAYQIRDEITATRRKRENTLAQAHGDIRKEREMIETYGFLSPDQLGELETFGDGLIATLRKHGAKTARELGAAPGPAGGRVNA